MHYGSKPSRPHPFRQTSIWLAVFHGRMKNVNQNGTMTVSPDKYDGRHTQRTVLSLPNGLPVRYSTQTRSAIY